MNVEFDSSFLKSLSKIKDQTILQRIKKAIIELEESTDLKKVRNLRKLTGYKNYFRIRIGDFRLGFESINDDNVRLIIISHRKDIYRNFP
jgi:mRNA interferase RelE/StbE